MSRNIFSYALLVVFFFGASAVSAETLGGGKPSSDTSTQSVETDETLGGGSPSLSDWFFGMFDDSSE